MCSECEIWLLFEPGDIYLSGRGGGCLLFVTGGRTSEAGGGVY